LKEITTALTSILGLLTLNPASRLVMFVSIALGLLAAWLAFSKTIKALKFPMNDGTRAVISFGVLVAFPLLSAAISHAYIAPKLSNVDLSRFAPLIVSLLVLLAAVTPITCFLLKSKYMQTLSSFLVPVITAAIMIFLTKGISGAIMEGDKGFITTKGRTESVNQVLSP